MIELVIVIVLIGILEQPVPRFEKRIELAEIKTKKILHTHCGKN